MNRIALIPLANEFTPDSQGWVRIAPYGSTPKTRVYRGPDGKMVQEKFRQDLTPAAAQAVADQANSLWGKLQRFRVGIPIYRHHPDLAHYSPATVNFGPEASPEEVGMLTELETRGDGLYGRVALHNAGQVAVENEGLKWLSPFWWAKAVTREGDVQVVQPFKLISAGLTDYPNIRGAEALANENNDIMNRQILIKLLGLPDTATDEQIVAAITALQSACAEMEPLENERNDLRGRLATTEATRDQLSNQVATLTTEAAEAATLRTRLQEQEHALANERTRADAILLDGAIAAGRLTAAERPACEVALANSATRESRLAEIASARPSLPTTSALGNSRDRRAQGDVMDAQNTIIALANERAKNFHEDYHTAFNKVWTERKDLVERLKTTAASA